MVTECSYLYFMSSTKVFWKSTKPNYPPSPSDLPTIPSSLPTLVFNQFRNTLHQMVLVMFE